MHTIYLIFNHEDYTSVIKHVLPTVYPSENSDSHNVSLAAKCVLGMPQGTYGQIGTDTVAYLRTIQRWSYHQRHVGDGYE